MNGVGAAPALEGAGIVLSRSVLADAVARARASLAAPADDGARFALLADNGIDWAIGSLALHESRAPNVPLPQWFTNTQLRQVLDQAGVDVVLTDDPARVLALDPAFTLAGVLPASGLMRLRRASSDARRPSLPRGTTKVTFTSGSTGTPKGVCLSAAALEAVAASLAEVTRPLGVRRHLSLLPLATLLEDVASLLAALRAGDCDLAVAFAYEGTDVGRGEDLDPFVIRPLMDDEVRLAMPPDHPLANRSVVDLADVASDSWIAGCPRCRGHLVSLAHSAGFSPNVAFETEDYVAVLGLVRAGLGVALVPDLILEAAHEDGIVARRLSPPSRRQIHAVTTEDLQRVPAVAATLDALEESARSRASLVRLP